MLNVYVHQVLQRILDKTYPESIPESRKIKKFWIELVPKEIRTYHGYYDPNEYRIRIVNLSRKPHHILLTTIHELAHHIDFCIYGSSGHNKRFYSIHNQLVKTAIKMGITTYAEFKDVIDNNDIKQLERYFGPNRANYDPAYDDKKDNVHIKVKNSFPIKDELKANGYKYNAVDQTWDKDCDKQLLEDEESFLYNLTDPENIEFAEGSQVSIQVIYYIIVDQCYSYKDSLKANGYRFKGFNQEGNVWVKKIYAQELENEKKFLAQFKDIKAMIKLVG